MRLLFLALAFGAVVLLFLIISMYRNRGKGTQSKIVKVLKFIVFIETILFIALFVAVFLKTMAM